MSHISRSLSRHVCPSQIQVPRNPVKSKFARCGKDAVWRPQRALTSFSRWDRADQSTSARTSSLDHRSLFCDCQRIRASCFGYFGSSRLNNTRFQCVSIRYCNQPSVQSSSIFSTCLLVVLPCHLSILFNSIVHLSSVLLSGRLITDGQCNLFSSSTHVRDRRENCSVPSSSPLGHSRLWISSTRR